MIRNSEKNLLDPLPEQILLYAPYCVVFVFQTFLFAPHHHISTKISTEDTLSEVKCRFAHKHMHKGTRSGTILLNTDVINIDRNSFYYRKSTAQPGQAECREGVVSRNIWRFIDFSQTKFNLPFQRVGVNGNFRALVVEFQFVIGFSVQNNRTRSFDCNANIITDLKRFVC